MESIDDILRLPLAEDVQNDKYYHFNPRLEICRAAEILRTYDYEWIGKLDLQLEDNSILLARLAKGANPDVRSRQPLADRRRLERRRDLLLSGWENIKTGLQSRSLHLLTLPIEIRDQIYSHLYTRSVPIDLMYPESDLNGRMLPRDPYFYMNASLVDPRIALEAATVFYQSNSFSFTTPYSSHISRFLSTDHYGSGVKPAAILRRIAIVLNGLRYYRYWYDAVEPGRDEHEVFEKQLRQNMSISPSVYRTRSLEAPLLEMPELCVLDVTIDKLIEGSLREIAPLFKKLRRRGVRVIVRLQWDLDLPPLHYDLYEVPGRILFEGRTHGASCPVGKHSASLDISRLFDDPTDEDREMLREHGERLQEGQDVAEEDLKVWFAKGRVVYKEQMDICERLDAEEMRARLEMKLR